MFTLEPHRTEIRRGLSGLCALPGKQVTTVAQIMARTLSLLVLTLTHIPALAASFLWSAMISDSILQGNLQD